VELRYARISEKILRDGIEINKNFKMLITQRDEHSFNSTFLGNADHGAVGTFQNNIIKECFFIVHVFASLSSGSNP
jgi:hypothetical protein